MESLQTLYREALQEPMTCFVFCGADDRAYDRALADLMPFLSSEYCLALMPDDSGLEGEQIRVVRDSDLSCLDFLRSALRQDPDTLILDSRARDGLAMLSQARLTGHRVIFHHSGSAEEARRDCFDECSKENEVLAEEFLKRALFFDLQKEGVEKVWQARDNSLVALLEKSDGEWQAVGQLERRPAPQSFSEVEVMEVPEEWPADGSAFLRELEERLGPHQRTAWSPALGAPGQSGEFGQFGGVPRLRAGEAWPRCGCCDTDMTLVLEVELEKAPEEFQKKVGDDGLFQFFYCQSQSCSVGQAWEAFQTNSLARVLREPAERADMPPRLEYEAIPIVGWQPLPEGPGWEDRYRLDIERDFLESDLVSTFSEMAETWTEGDSYYDAILEYFGLSEGGASECFRYVKTLPGDKLLGWPVWSQGVEYPHCPDCQKQMEILVQINNDGHGAGSPGYGSALGQVFAGDGNGHISYCPEHGQMTFAWACG